MGIDNILFKKFIYILGDSARKTPLMILLFIVLSALEVIGIGIIAPYIALIVSPEKILNSDTYNVLLSYGLLSDLNDVLIGLSLLLFTVFLIASIVGFLINRAIFLFCINHGAKLRSFLMYSYQNMPYEEYIARNSSEYVYQIQELAAKFSHTTLQASLRVVSEGIVFITIVLFLAWVDLVAVLILTVLITVLALAYDWLFKGRVDNYGKQVNRHSKKMIQGINEGIEGLKEVRILGKEDYFYKIVKENAIQYSQLNTKSAVISSLPKYMTQLLIITFVVLIVISAVLLEKKLDTLVPILGVFGVAAIRLIPSMNQIMSSIVQIRLGKDSIRLLYSDVKKFKKHSDGKSAKSTPNRNREEILLHTETFKNLTLNEVNYKYPDSKQNVLNNISLEIKSGESIGVIGSSGSGKTTLIDTMLGLLKPNSGSITVNDKTIGIDGSHWQRHVAYLPQQVFLIDNTVRQNIALGIEEEEIDDDKVMKAIHQVQLTDVVSQLPNGLDTILGERGVRLSGGQRQRIALARAFYHDRDVLIMDESTSALDNETESEIVKEIKQFKGKKTIIVIAHRLTTLKHCDRIYKLDNGHIVDVGSYEKIIEGINS